MYSTVILRFTKLHVNLIFRNKGSGGRLRCLNIYRMYVCMEMIFQSLFCNNILRLIKFQRMLHQFKCNPHYEMSSRMVLTMNKSSALRRLIKPIEELLMWQKRSRHYRQRRHHLRCTSSQLPLNVSCP